jgi:sialate O-acetylesterase
VGEIADNDTTWLNGSVIGRTNQFGVPRRYPVAAGLAKPGKNTITLRVTNAGGGGILADKHPLCIHPEGGEKAAISLSGKWRLQETAKMADTGRPMVGNPNVPSVLYNGMIAPLAPCSLTGVIWYQGEANASRAHQYRRLLPALIRDWRDRFQRDDLAFHIVSLANYQDPHDQPRDHSWAELREAQAMTAKKCAPLRACRGHRHRRRRRHPSEKQKGCGQTARPQRARQHLWQRSPDLAPGSARLRSRMGASASVSITAMAASGCKGPSARSFASPEKDRKFAWAQAVIDGDSIVVSSPAVPQPLAVRYAWDANPEACLFNGAGLPAVPFRSDDWPGVTEGNKLR